MNPYMHSGVHNNNCHSIENFFCLWEKKWYYKSQSKCVSRMIWRKWFISSTSNKLILVIYFTYNTIKIWFYLINPWSFSKFKIFYQWLAHTYGPIWKVRATRFLDYGLLPVNKIIVVRREPEYKRDSIPNSWPTSKVTRQHFLQLCLAPVLY